MSHPPNSTQSNVSLKRQHSPSLEIGSNSKRVKKEDEEAVLVRNGSENLRHGHGRDKKKRRHKKKKKVPVVQQGTAVSTANHEGEPTTFPPKRVALSPAKSNTPGPSRIGRSPSPHERPGMTLSEGEESIPYKDKGKGRAVSPTHPALHSDAASLASHRTLFSNLLPSLMCQICLQLMYRPFSLVPCGHIACHSCLINWFSNDPGSLGQAPPPVPAPPQGDGPDDAPVPGPAVRPNLPVVRRKKTCPHCRTVVRNKPVEAWSIKDMVGAVVRSGLADPDAVPLELQDGAEPSGDGAADPWKDIFSGADAENRNYDRLMNEMSMGIRDDEDGGVYRCVDCLHEIFDGHCTHCGRLYLGHRIGMDSDSDMDDIGPIWEDEADREDGYDLFQRVIGAALGRNHGNLVNDGFLDPQRWNPDDHDDIASSRALSPVDSDLDPPGFLYGRHNGSGPSHDGHEDLSDEEAGYESSFIDDDGDDGPREGDVGSLGGGSSDIEILPEVIRRPTRYIRGAVVLARRDNDDDDEEEEEEPQIRRPRTIVISDSEDEADDAAADDLAAAVAAREFDIYGDDGSLPPRRLRREFSEPLDLTRSDDEDDDDDVW